MRIDRLWLTDFRSYGELAVEFAPGFTALIGPNGVGKTNLLESLGLLSSLKSFRGSPTESLVRQGASRAVVRAEGERDGRPVLIELELGRGRSRVQVNRQKLGRSRDLLGALRVTVFAPDDLRLVKGGPSERRQYLDDLLVALDTENDGLQSDLERVLKQRAALLRSAGGRRLDEAAAFTLDVWDERLVAVGERIVARRQALLGDLVDLVRQAYWQLSGKNTELDTSYVASWSGSFTTALADARPVDLRRGVTTIGPHRDEMELRLSGLSARTEASQGEQRSLALALRLAGHQLVTQRLGEPPLLLLDDVLSELDEDRAARLLAMLPPGQTVVTSAVSLPPTTVTDSTLHWEDGELVTVRSPLGATEENADGPSSS